MNQKLNEKGQALIIIALAAVVLFGFTALAVDGSRAFSDKRNAQNAADAAALAGSLAYIRGNNATDAAQTRATSNGYDNGVKSDVTITLTDITKASGICGDVAGKEIQVDIVSYIDTTFARVIGTNQVINRVTATGRGCGFYRAPLFNGNAIVGLNPTNTQCAYDSGNSGAVHWNVEGGGIFSNGCAFTKNTSTVDLNGYCMTSVGGASGFVCQNSNQASEAVSYPADVLAMMPPNPCDGTPGDIGLPQGSGSNFSYGVYCITDMDALDKKDIVLDNAMLYVTDPSFDLKFAGSGGFYGTPYPVGDYANYYMIVAYNGDPCTSFTDKKSQVIEWRGNGAGSFSGTVLAPSACIDLRGNADQSAMHSQIIAYNVGSNGNAEVYIKYESDENVKLPVQPSVTLVK